ncbi:MAG: TPM domain-containing protein [Betaproteobacteria bacterium]
MIASADQVVISNRIADLEAASGVEVVTIVVAKSDVYPETVWKAFGLGASLSALVVVVHDLLRPTWASAGGALWPVVGILGIGALWALSAVYVPAFTRLFLRKSRAETEVTQLAAVQFLQRELFDTPPRTAVLVLVSMLEQHVVIRADVGLQAQVTKSEWDAVIERMLPALRRGTPAPAIQDGIAAMGALFAAKGFAPSTRPNRFDNRAIEASEP